MQASCSPRATHPVLARNVLYATDRNVSDLEGLEVRLRLIVPDFDLAIAVSLARHQQPTTH